MRERDPLSELDRSSSLHRSHLAPLRYHKRGGWAVERLQRDCVCRLGRVLFCFFDAAVPIIF